MLGGWRTVLWYQGRSRVVPGYCQGRKGVPGAILSIEKCVPAPSGEEITRGFLSKQEAF